jgi:hypothetical protein
MIIRDKSKLPDWRPIAWRETTKRSLGRTHYLFRIFLAIEIPLCVVLLLIALLGNEGATRGATVMLFLLWPLAVLMVSVCAASLIAGERTHQTLDVLCTTPIAGREILRQKFQVVRRLTWVLSIPFFTIFVFEAWWRSSTSYPDWRGEHFRAVLYLICSALSVFVYLPMIAWLSLLIGLVIRTQARAIIAALGTIVGWCLLPFVFIMLPLEIMAGPIHSNSGLTFFTLLSPLSIVPFNEFAGLQGFAELPWLAVIVNFTGYGAVLALLRQACLANADRFLGRLELTGQAVTIT